MYFKFKHLDKFVGGFFILAVICLLALLVTVARGQRWFQDYVSYKTTLSNSRGLQRGDQVIINGLEVGRVVKIDLSANDMVSVDFKIFSGYAKHMREGTKSMIDSPMVGSARIILKVGPEDAAELRPGSNIPSGEEEAASLDELIESATELAKKLGDEGGSLMTIIKDIADGRGTLGQFVINPVLYNRLAAITNNVQGITKSLDEASPDIKDAIVAARRDLEEANKVIHALQKSIFLSGSIENYLGEDRLLTGAESYDR